MKKFLLLISVIFVDHIICMNATNEQSQNVLAYNVLYTQIQNLQNKNATLQLQKQQLKECAEQQSTQLQQLANTNHELQEKMRKLEQENRQTQDQYHLIQQEVKQKDAQIKALQNKLNQQGNNADNKQDENTDNQQDKDNKQQDNNNQDPKQNSDVGSVTINTIHKTRENNNTNNNSESAKILKIDKNSQTQIDINYSDVADHLSIISEKPKIIVHSSDKSPDIIPPSTNKTEAKSVAS